MKKVYFLLFVLTLLFAGSAFAAAEFQIVLFDLVDADTGESISLVSVKAADSVDVEAVVRIRNIGSDAGDETLTIVIKDSKGVVLDTNTATSTNLNPLGSAGDSTDHTLTFTIPGSWEAGLYSFYATVYNNTDGLSDGQELKTLTLVLITPPPVPELDFVFIPLLALSVLAVLFFADKRQSGKL